MKANTRHYVESVCMATWLICWDFDYTIVNENTDTFFVKQLDEKLNTMFDTYTANDCWTDFMQELLVRMNKMHGFSAEKILDTFYAIPMFAEIQRVILQNCRKKIPQFIISDSNSLFIRASLHAHGLSSCFSDDHIFTNPASVDVDGIIRVNKFCQNNPHSCRSCPLNMCKKQILQTIRSKYPNFLCVYVGDGANDFCPTLQLTLGDFVFARTGKFRLGNLWKRKLENEMENHGSSPSVYFWENGKELEFAFDSIPLYKTTDILYTFEDVTINSQNNTSK